MAAAPDTAGRVSVDMKLMADMPLKMALEEQANRLCH